MGNQIVKRLPTEDDILTYNLYLEESMVSQFIEGIRDVKKIEHIRNELNKLYRYNEAYAYMFKYINKSDVEITFYYGNNEEFQEYVKTLPPIETTTYEYTKKCMQMAYVRICDTGPITDNNTEYILSRPNNTIIMPEEHFQWMNCVEGRYDAHKIQFIEPITFSFEDIVEIKRLPDNKYTYPVRMKLSSGEYTIKPPKINIEITFKTFGKINCSIDEYVLFNYQRKINCIDDHYQKYMPTIDNIFTLCETVGIKIKK